MEETILNQILIFLYSFILGLLLCALYDVFRIIRLLVSWKNWSIFFQDIIYFFVSGIITFLFMLIFNYGEIRFYILIGEFFGWIVYYNTIGKLIYKFFEKFIKIVFNFLNKYIMFKIKAFIPKIVNKNKSNVKYFDKI